MAEPREQLAAALASYLTQEQVEKLINEVLAIEKRASTEVLCKYCKRSQHTWVTVPDAKAVALALPDLLNQAYGRPSEQENMEQIIFKRLTKLEDDVAA